jgi:hypothetical protein
MPWVPAFAGKTNVSDWVRGVRTGPLSSWLDSLPQSLAESAAEALRAITHLDLSELQSIEPPRGYGCD